MAASSIVGSDQLKNLSGIVQGHAYTLLKVILFNYKGEGHRLVQLRNPWGKFEAKSKWSDTDPIWNQISAE
jgi:hypothetical protein